MPYQALTKFKITLVIAFALTYTSSALAAVTFPKCDSLAEWGAKSYEQDKNIRQGNFFGGKYKGKYLMFGLMDDFFKPIFGTTFDKLNNKDLQQFKSSVKKCLVPFGTAAKAASKRGNASSTTYYNNAGHYIKMFGVIKPDNRIDSFPQLMGYQKTVYAEHKKARIIKADQLVEAKNMSATKANIQKLTVMAKILNLFIFVLM